MKLTWMDAELQELLPKLSESQIVAVCLFGEARSEPIEGIVAVANVIRNRVKADLHGDKKPDWWGEGYSDVVTRPWQFSMWHANGGAANHKRVKALVKHLADKQPVVDLKARQCVGVAQCVIGDYFADNVAGADHYHTAAMTPRPKWAQSVIPVKQIAAHVFYRLQA